MHEENVADYYQRRKTPGEIIKNRRRQLDWSQDELEWRSGVSRTQISRIERGIAKPGVATIGKLEEALGMPLLNEFLEYGKRTSGDGRKPLSKKKLLKRIEKDLLALDLTEEELQSVIERVNSNKTEKDF